MLKLIAYNCWFDNRTVDYCFSVEPDADIKKLSVIDVANCMPLNSPPRYYIRLALDADLSNPYNPKLNLKKSNELHIELLKLADTSESKIILGWPQDNINVSDPTEKQIEFAAKCQAELNAVLK